MGQAYCGPWLKCISELRTKPRRIIIPLQLRARVGQIHAWLAVAAAKASDSLRRVRMSDCSTDVVLKHQGHPRPFGLVFEDVTQSKKSSFCAPLSHHKGNTERLVR